MLPLLLISNSNSPLTQLPPLRAPPKNTQSHTATSSTFLILLVLPLLHPSSHQSLISLEFSKRSLPWSELSKISCSCTTHFEITQSSSTMVKCSNSLIGILNVFSLILSVVILGGGIWLSKHGSTDCETFFQKATIAVGVFLLLVSIAGIIGACCGVSWLLWLYLVVMFLLIILLLCFAIFGFVVTNKGAGEALSGKGYKEYRLGDYSNWLQKRVNDNKNWAKIRSCLQDAKVCQHLLEIKSADDQAFAKRKLSSLESGCCKPSNDCGFIYVNGNWTQGQVAGPAPNNPDCKAWNNDPALLCYSCQSCKAGFLDNIKSLWKKMAVLIVIVWVFLVIVYSVGCCAFRNNRESNAWKRYP